MIFFRICNHALKKIFFIFPAYRLLPTHIVERGEPMLFHTFLFVFLAEMADKTQLMIMALTNRYSVKTVIAGMILGVFAISGVSVLAGDLIGDLIPMRLIKLAASAMFLFF